MTRSLLASSVAAFLCLGATPAAADLPCPRGTHRDGRLCCPDNSHKDGNLCVPNSRPPDPAAIGDQARRDAEALKKKTDEAANRAAKDAAALKKKTDEAANKAVKDAEALRNKAQADMTALMKSAKDPAACAKANLRWSPVPTPHCVKDPCKAGEFSTPVGCIKGDVQALTRCMATNVLPKRPAVRNAQDLQKLARQRVEEMLGLVTTDMREMFKPNPADKITNGASALNVFMRRLDKAGARDPALKCLAAFVRPTLLVMGPQVDLLIAHGRAMMDQVFREVIQKHIDQVVNKAILDTGAMVVGEAKAKEILQKRIAQYLYDISTMQAGAKTISAVATTVNGGGDVKRAVEEMKRAIARKKMERAELTFDVLGDVIDLKAMQWVTKRCTGPWAPKQSEEKKAPRKDDKGGQVAQQGGAQQGSTTQGAAKSGGKEGAGAANDGEKKTDWLGDDWSKNAGNKLHEQLVQKAEDLVPGGRCLIDYSIKPLETINTSLKATIAAACNIAPDATFTGLIAVYGGGSIPLGARVTAGLTLACSAFLWAYDKLASMAIAQLKSEAYKFSELVTQKFITKAKADLRTEIKNRNGFADVDKFIREMKAAGGPSAIVVRSIDGGLLLFMNKYAGRFLEAMEAYQKSIDQLGDTAAQLSKGGGK